MVELVDMRPNIRLIVRVKILWQAPNPRDVAQKMTTHRNSYRFLLLLSDFCNNNCVISLK
jgi:hypothetical protein